MIVSLLTLGCKVNHYETQAMAELFAAAGWEVKPFPAKADAYVVNTCTVTGMSDGKSRRLIARAHRLNPDALIAVTGCYAQTEPDEAAALPGVGLVFGVDARKDAVTLVSRALEGDGGVQAKSLVRDIQKTRVFEPLSAVRDGRTRATLKIEDGCANYCAYCVIPYARGPVRSRPLEDVRAELARLACEGYREVVLAGIHLASYGRDLPDRPDLIGVLEAAKTIDGIDRIRLGSLEPKFADERFAEAAANNPKLCRQFHLSLQSGAADTLARMRRRYTPEEYARAVSLLRAAMPGCAITTDVIAGFPGETDAAHAESLAFCEEMRFMRTHVFPFSPRRGTAAAAMPDQVEKAVKDARAAELIALGKRSARAFLRGCVGSEADVLVESDGCGYTDTYARVSMPGAAEGALLRALLTGLDEKEETLLGKELYQK